MPEVAKLIRVERVGRAFKLEINGEEFPYHLAGDQPITTRMEQDGFASIRFTLWAERLELIDEPFPGEVGDGA